MKKFLTLFALMTSANVSMAQPAKPTYAYYEGVNLSMGLGQNVTKETISSESITGTTSTTVGKANYTFALAYPAKLGVSATFDLKNSKIGETEYLSISSPTEITIEPGVLLMSNSLLYGKLGTYASKYEARGLPSRNLTGTSYGIGIKHYIYGQNFFQVEWTQRTPSEAAGLAGVKFKQSSAVALVGFNF
jgi:hypothetical protein